MAASKDFSRPNRRIRIALTKYDPVKRGYMGVDGQAARIDCNSEIEQRRLWLIIEDVIKSGTWRSDRHTGTRDRVRRPVAHQRVAG